MANLKSVVIFSAILSSISLSGIAQQFTGFKNTETQKKLESNFDSQLSANRIGENIKLMSLVVGSPSFVKSTSITVCGFPNSFD